MTGARQITEAEKQSVLERQGRRCFIDNHPIDSTEDVEFDHIQPFSEGGKSTVDNIAVVCKRHNREKRALSLGEYRDRVALRRFFERARKRRLDDLLAERLGESGYGNSVALEMNASSVSLYLDEGTMTTPLMECPATGERYFFAPLPVALVKNDGELQPRALEAERVWEFRHLRTHTQLAPAVCRLVGGSVLLFDGQHKAAAPASSSSPSRPRRRHTRSH